MPNVQDKTILVVLEDITFLEDLRNCNFARTPEETRGLEHQIITEGRVRVPFTLWPHEGKLICTDGYTRGDILRRNKLNWPIPAELIAFQNMTEAKMWIVTNENNRRSLTDDQAAYERGKLYEQLKFDREALVMYLTLKGLQHLIPPASAREDDKETSEILGKSYTPVVSGKTIRRCNKFFRSVEFIRTLNDELAEDILHQRIWEGDKPIKVNRGLIESLLIVEPRPKRLFDLSDIQEAVDTFKGNKEKSAQRELILGIFKKFWRQPSPALREQIMLELDKCFNGDQDQGNKLLQA